jgi:hypothetical protein
MLGSKGQKEDRRLLRLQEDIARDRLRLQQRVGIVDDERPVEDAAFSRATGRLYEVFVAMGEA